MLQKPVAIIARPSGTPGSALAETAALYAYTGNNTGNLAFWHAVPRHIAGEVVLYDWFHDPAAINTHCRAVVFVAANQLNPNLDQSALADWLEKLTLPLAVVGLGAQLQFDTAQLTLAPGTIRFAQVLAERAKTIGVRGVYTAAVLADLGIHNTVVTGCPSNYINPLPDLGRRIEARLRAYPAGGRLCLPLDFQPYLVPPLQHLLKLCADAPYEIVVQAPLEEIQLARQEDVPDATLQALHAFMPAAASLTEVQTAAMQTFRAFFSVEAWMEYARQCRLSLGTRLHGNMLALQAGTPAVFIPHDKRVQELVETLHLPHLPLAAIMACRSLEELLASVRFDGAAYDTNRAALAVVYRQLLADAGITPTALLGTP